MKRFTCLLPGVALLVVAGCLDYREALVIRKDGSAVVSMRYAFDRTYFDRTKAMTKQIEAVTGNKTADEDGSEAMFDRQDIEHALAERGGGVKLLSYETSETDRDRIWDMKFALADVNRLYDLSEAVMPEEEGDEETPPVPIFTRRSDGTWLFQRIVEQEDEAGAVDAHGTKEAAEAYAGAGEEDASPGVYGDAEADDAAGSDEEAAGSEEEADTPDEEAPESVDLEAVAESMQGLGAAIEKMAENSKDRMIRFAVTFPGTIVESNATRVEGSTAVWEYSLDQLEGGVEPQRAVIRP